MRLIARLLLGTAGVLGIAGSASAGPLTAATILQDFNAVIYTNATTTSDVEGAAIIGGNFSGATNYNNPVGTQPAGFGALTVYGSTSGNSINIDNGGSAYVAGTKGSAINFNGGGSYIGAPGPTIADLEPTLNALSTSLSKLAATAAIPVPTNNEVFTATPGSNGIAVFDLSASDLSSIPSFSVNLNGASLVVFNVEGSSPTFSANDESGTNGANKIIWNFYDATGTVAINTQIGGTVLATGANVTNQNQIDGALVAKSWTGQGELHNWQLTGTLPSDPVSVPEPASLAMLGIGLAALGFCRVKRRSQSA